ncbi:LOB domain-containing protein 37-like [Bidens hawaiensis]|uniref:LOB domain-containing protein 37-like n=1 Tax=Bidens hawaiensis TaxID=980011 RepID=UPI00404965C9
MSCNGCRVLRKGCSDNCILRPCLQWIDSPAAQAHATLFVAKFFGRAGLMSFISSVPQNQRPSLFQSLLYEAAGRTVNPVNGAVGLLGTGNWHVCQASVETVLQGGTLRPIPELVDAGFPVTGADVINVQDLVTVSRSKVLKRRRSPEVDLDLNESLPEKRRQGSPSMNSGESSVTCFRESGCSEEGREVELLDLFKC